MPLCIIIPEPLLLKAQKERTTAILTPALAKDIPIEQAIFREAWELVKDYHNIEEYDMDDEWRDLINKADQIYLRGAGRSPAEEMLGMEMAQLVLRYLDTVGMGKGAH